MLTSAQERVLDAPAGRGRVGTLREMIEAFLLVVDGASQAEAARLVGVSPQTVSRWANAGTVLFPGVAVEDSLTWEQIVLLGERVRAQRAASLAERGEMRHEYERRIETKKADFREAIETAVATITRHMVMKTVDAKGAPWVKMSAADLGALLKAQNLLDGKATEIVEHRSRDMEAFAQFAMKALTAYVPEERQRVRVLRSLRGDLQQYLTLGGAYETLLGGDALLVPSAAAAATQVAWGTREVDAADVLAGGEWEDAV